MFCLKLSGTTSRLRYTLTQHNETVVHTLLGEHSQAVAMVIANGLRHTQYPVGTDQRLSNQLHVVHG